MVTRRQVLGAGLLAGAALLRSRPGSAAAEPVEIRMMSDPAGSKVHFDPIGILIEPGRRVRWRCVANVHTTTARRGAPSVSAPRVSAGERATAPARSSYLSCRATGDHWHAADHRFRPRLR